MNVETESQNFNDPAVLDERVASMVNTLIQVADPRLIVNALLTNAAGLTGLVLAAGKATPSQVAAAFSGALADALSPAEAKKDEPRIRVVPAGVVPIRP